MARCWTQWWRQNYMRLSTSSRMTARGRSGKEYGTLPTNYRHVGRTRASMRISCHMGMEGWRLLGFKAPIYARVCSETALLTGTPDGSGMMVPFTRVKSKKDIPMDGAKWLAAECTRTLSKTAAGNAANSNLVKYTEKTSELGTRQRMSNHCFWISSKT